MFSPRISSLYEVAVFTESSNGGVVPMSLRAVEPITCSEIEAITSEPSLFLQHRQQLFRRLRSEMGIKSRS